MRIDPTRFAVAGPVQGEPTLQATRVVDHAGIVHVWLGDMSGCGIPTTAGLWRLTNTEAVSCHICLHNLRVMSVRRTP